LKSLQSAKLGQNKKAKSMFSFPKRKERMELHGYEHLDCSREDIQNSLDPKNWKGNKAERWKVHMEKLTAEKIISNLAAFEAMKHILKVLIQEKGFKPPRASWLDSFSVSCSSQLYHGNCGCCDGC
jgi:hypothetical protein